MIRRLAWSFGCALLVAVGIGNSAGAEAATAIVTPATGGNGVPVIFGHAAFELAGVGYTQEEFFLEGTAGAYAPGGPLEMDGRWTVTPFMPMAYKTRILVNRPVDPRKFSGTVIAEWHNVSGGVDATPDWQHMHVELIRKGHAWVGVSAQWVGVNQLACPLAPPTPGCTAPGDATRYRSLNHPGDSWSYDIFSQAGQAIRGQAGLVLDGLVPKHVIAAGESQSASRLVTYIDAVHPVVKVYDAFVVHSRGDDGAPLTQSLAGRAGSPPIPTPDVPAPDPTLIRDDLDVPVMVFANENDLGSLEARQPDGPLYRLWETTGTAHFDLYGLVQAANDTGERGTVEDWFDSMLNPTQQPNPDFSCEIAINSGPATFVMRALVRALNTWLVEGTPAPMAPRFQTNGLASIYDVDAIGNVLGGIRTPAVDAPVAQLNGLGQPRGGANRFCFLFGITVPLTEQVLSDRYGTHGGFVSAWSQATQNAVQAGFLLREDAQQLRAVGAQSDILKKN